MLSPHSLDDTSEVGSQPNIDYRNDIERLTNLCKDLEPSSSKAKKKLQASHREYLHDEINTLEKRLKETNYVNHTLKEQLSQKENELEVLFYPKNFSHFFFYNVPEIQDPNVQVIIIR